MSKFILKLIIGFVLATLLFAYIGCPKEFKKNVRQHKNIINAGQKEIEKDRRGEILNSFFKKQKSPWENMGQAFVEIADENNLDWRLLPAIACVESSCGKVYRYNAFGFASDSRDYGSDLEDAQKVANFISTSKVYLKYQKTNSLLEFSKSYNPKFWREYFTKLNYFYNLLD